MEARVRRRGTRTLVAMLYVVATCGVVLAVSASPAAADGPPIPELVQVEAGGGTTCAITAAGAAYCWGADEEGQLGNGAALTGNQVSPSPVDTPAGVTWAEISTGDAVSCGVTTTGAAYCWGWDLSGVLGNGPALTADQPSPSLVATPLGVSWAEVSVGLYEVCALSTTGALYCWGSNNDGTGSHDTPTLVSSGPWSSVSVAGDALHACGVAGGVGYCWGTEHHGELGDGGAIADVRAVPTPVAAPQGVVWATIHAGGGATCGTTVDGDAYCWGQDLSGVLGNGPTITGDQPAPTQVVTPAGVVWTEVVSEDLGACGLTTTGAVYCWGQTILGTGAVGGSRPSPGPITAPAGAEPWSSPTVGRGHACAIAADGPTYCWGTASSGQLGIGYAYANSVLWSPTLVGAAQTITFAALPDVELGTPPFDLTATASSGLPVSFAATGPCTVDGTTVTVDATGSCTITASQAGGGGWAGALPVARTFTVTAPDGDHDGVADSADNCPTVPNGNQADVDHDTSGDACDADIDGDGVSNDEDAFPLDATEWVDTDYDGVGNNEDWDDDDDGWADEEDALPLDPYEHLDFDHDGIGNNADPDDDNDGVPDAQDALPLDPTESVDTDHDGIGNNADTDDDNDGVPDAQDAFPLNRSESVDTDHDGIGDTADADDDNDGTADGADAFPLDASESVDTDHDGIGNNADTDDDGDGVADSSDAFPLDANESVDTDHDGIGNNADTDDDNDGILDAEDAFPNDPTESVDTDHDGIGNNADTDDDNDGILDTQDAFPNDAGESADSDHDGIGDTADTDDDNDGILDTQDAFPLEKDGALSGNLSRQIKANPALAPVLTPLRAGLLALGL